MRPSASPTTTHCRSATTTVSVKGLTALVSYTYSKFLDNVEGNNSWSYSGNPGPANNYNLAAEKSVDGSDIPHALVASYVYQLPVGRGKAVRFKLQPSHRCGVGGWEVSQIASFKQGIPISVSGSDIASYGGNPRPDVVGNVHVANPTFTSGSTPPPLRTRPTERSARRPASSPICVVRVTRTGILRS